jgi:hypothetical protein
MRASYFQVPEPCQKTSGLVYSGAAEIGITETTRAILGWTLGAMINPGFTNGHDNGQAVARI